MQEPSTTPQSTPQASTAAAAVISWQEDPPLIPSNIVVSSEENIA